MNKIPVAIFDAKIIGASLKEVAVDILQREGKEIENHWYHSRRDADIYYWRDSNRNIIKQQVTFCGQLTEWSQREGIRTGVLIEDESSQAISGSPLIHYDQVPQRQALAQSIEILQHTVALPRGDRKDLLANFSAAPLSSDREVKIASGSFLQYLAKTLGHFIKKK